ncbi:MAG: hypothetical protein IJQ82_02365 [Selenomonadaceae bacterium]|nr:hypothetical protein [Selenomonadaceae bacterium]
MTVTTKNAKNGARLYYVDSKRVSRQIALEVAAQNRAGNPFVIEYDTEQTHFFVDALDKKKKPAMITITEFVVCLSLLEVVIWQQH